MNPDRPDQRPLAGSPAPAAARGARRVARVAALAAGALVGASVLAACDASLTIADGDSGPRTTVTHELEPVRAVDIGTSGTVHLVVGEEPSLTITAGETVVEEIVVVVSGDTLDIDLPGMWLNTGGIEMELVMPALSAVTVRGSAEVTGEIAPQAPVSLSIDGSGGIDVLGAGAADEVAVEIEGSGEVSLEDVDAQDVSVTIAGSGSVELAGRTETLVVSIPGSGELDSEDLRAADVMVTIAGSGGADVHAERILDVRIQGSGDVRYTGDPEVQQDIDGSGSVARD